MADSMAADSMDAVASTGAADLADAWEQAAESTAAARGDEPWQTKSTERRPERSSASAFTVSRLPTHGAVQSEACARVRSRDSQ